MTRILAALLAALFASAASAQLYRWVDQNGKVHYTDTPPQPAAARAVEKKKPSGSVVEAAAPYAVQQAAKTFPVTLYTASNCEAPCKDARDLLAKRGVPYSETAITEQKQLDELKRLSGGDDVPVLLVGKSVIKGFEAGAYNGALDTAGYPLNAPPTTTARAPKAPEPPKPAQQAIAPQAVVPAPAPGPYAPR
jgi:glutaredoxin